MNTRMLSLVPALITGIAGIALLYHQSAEITAIQEALPHLREWRRVPAVSSPHAPQKPAASAGLTTGDERAAAFLAGLAEKLRPLVESSEREAVTNRARFIADRTALLLGLPAEEKAALQQHLETRPDSNAAAREWIAAHAPAKQLEAFDASEAARRTAEVEHRAQEAIFRVSRIVDLTPEQKDQLYAGFVSKAAAAAPANEAAPLELRTAISIGDTPRISDAAQLSRPLLTPEQLAVFNSAVKQESKIASESTRRVMAQLLSAAMSAFQEVASEKE